MKLKWNKYEFDFEKRTYIMGVLNVTPDSFSDGGKYYSLEKAVEHGVKMAEQGADIIDIGGESTRPFSERVSAQEEIDRVVPVIEALSGRVDVPISIDTYKSEVAKYALDAGASIINDISALRFDPSLGTLAAERRVPVILMHMKGTPENMQKNPYYDDVVGEISEFLDDAVKRAGQCGIEKDLVVVDPGIGFGKTFEHNLIILRDLKKFHSLRRPILIGTSNKSFIGHVLDRAVEQRAVGTMATVAVAVLNGAHMVRVHNVEMAVDTVRMVDAIKRGSTN